MAIRPQNRKDVSNKTKCRKISTDNKVSDGLNIQRQLGQGRGIEMVQCCSSYAVDMIKCGCNLATWQMTTAYYELFK